MRQHKVADDDIDLSKPVELVALSVKERTARSRLLGSDQIVTLRVSRLWEVAPGAIVTVTPRKQWHYGGHPYLSGDIQSIRIDVNDLDLVPLGLAEMGMWDPNEEYWGEKDEPIEEWAKPIIAHGPRPMFEMEQVLPGEDPDDPSNDPIIRSNDFKNAGELGEAKKILMELCQADLRCLDAHSHLGNFVFDHWPQNAIRHYEVGLRIGELSLGDDFTGILAWGLIDNGVASAALIGAGIGCFALGLLTLLTEVNSTIENALDFYAPTGPVSGITTLAVVVWLVAWVAMHLLWKNRRIDFRKVYIVVLVLVALGVLGCFPFFEAPEWGE